MSESATSSAISPLSGWHSSSLSTSTPRRCRRRGGGDTRGMEGLMLVGGEVAAVVGAAGTGAAAAAARAARQRQWRAPNVAQGRRVSSLRLAQLQACKHLGEHGVEGVLGVDQGDGAACLLHFRHGMQRQGGLAAGLCSGTGAGSTCVGGLGTLPARQRAPGSAGGRAAGGRSTARHKGREARRNPPGP